MNKYIKLLISELLLIIIIVYANYTNCLADENKYKYYHFNSKHQAVENNRKKSDIEDKYNKMCPGCTIQEMFHPAQGTYSCIITCNGHEEVRGKEDIKGDIFDKSIIPTDTGEDKLKHVKIVTTRIWNILSLILKICSIAGVIFAGIHYMLASGNVKSEIKSSMSHLIIGICIVFGGTYVIDFITRIFNDATGF